MDNQIQIAAAVTTLKELVANCDNHIHPFLYYIPKILTLHELQTINTEHVISFVQQATKRDPPVLIKDALKILDRLIIPEDGTFITPTKEIFYENRSFFWNDLGNFTKPTDIISHIMNRSYFEIMVGQYH